MIDSLTDPALLGLEDRARGSACTTACRAGCTATCHERCKPTYRRSHDQYYCDQIRLGRDVTEYRPDIRQAIDADKQAAREGYEQPLLGSLRDRNDGGDLFGGRFTSQRMPWYARLLARMRGFDA